MKIKELLGPIVLIVVIGAILVWDLLFFYLDGNR